MLVNPNNLGGWITSLRELTLYNNHGPLFKKQNVQGAVVRLFNTSTSEVEAGGTLSSRITRSTKQVPGQPVLHRRNSCLEPKL